MFFMFSFNTVSLTFSLLFCRRWPDFPFLVLVPSAELDAAGCCQQIQELGRQQHGAMLERELSAVLHCRLLPLGGNVLKSNNTKWSRKVCEVEKKKNLVGTQELTCYLS